MDAVPRRAFLPADQQRHSERDAPLPIGHGQTNSQPTTVRRMLELLDVQPGHRVLDVGCGSGWTTALLAWLTGPSGQVWGVERVPDLATFGAANVSSAGMPWAHVRGTVPHELGLSERAPFDRILVSAQARVLPSELVAQLAPRGVLVMPVSGRMMRVTATGEDASGLQVEEHGWYRFVPLVADPPPRPLVN